MAKQYVSNFLAADLPARLINYRNYWNLTSSQLPDPLMYASYEPFALDRWPTIITLVMGTDSINRMGYSGMGEPQLQVSYDMRTYVWVRATGTQAVTDQRDNLTTVVREALMDHPSLSAYDNSVPCSPKIDESTIVEQFSDLTLIKGERLLAGAFVGYTLTLDEDITAESLGVVYTTSSVVQPIPVVPNAPTNLLAVAGDEDVALSWVESSWNGGVYDISGYVIQRSSDGGLSWSTVVADTGSVDGFYRVAGLSADTYQFRVAALNEAGTGAYSASSNAVTVVTSVPGQVGVVTPTAGVSEVALSWAAPSPGSSPITDYVVQYSINGLNWTTFADGVSDATTAIVTGLTNETLYHFRVAAVSDVGTGLYSNSVSARFVVFSPLDLSPTLWLDASDTGTITESGGSVSQWDDKSGNDNHATEATAAYQPTTGTRTMNSLNVLDFASNRLQGTYDTTLPCHIFAVAQLDATSAERSLVDGKSSARRVIGTTAANEWKITNSYLAGTTITGGSVDTEAYVFHAYFDNGASSELFVDSVSIVSGDAGTSESVSGITIGSTYVFTLDPWDGIIAEIVIVSGTLTAEQISDTETYLANKWGMTLP